MVTHAVLDHRSSRREARILLAISQVQHGQAQAVNARLTAIENFQKSGAQKTAADLLSLERNLTGLIIDGRADPDPAPIWKRLASELDPEFPGRGLELYTQTVQDEAMAYGSVAYAAAKRGQIELARRAADWLVNNPNRRKDGAIGWGLSFAWDAFQDGTENPKNSIYGITVAFAAQGLLETYDVTKDRRYLVAAERALLDYAAIGKTATDGSLALPYSDQPPDQQYEVYNVSIYLAGQIRKAADLTASPQLRQIADKSLASVLKRASEERGALYWPYSDFNLKNPNDTLHAAFFVSSLADSGVGADILGKAKAYLDRSLKNGKVLKWPIGHAIAEEAGTAWDLGSLLFALCKAGHKQEAGLIFIQNRTLFYKEKLHIRALGQALMAVAECDLH